MVSKKPFKPKSWQVLRFEVLKRDGFRCQYCGLTAKDTQLHADHIVPRCEGGKDEARNLVTACKDCNEGKWGRVLGRVLPTFADLLSSVRRKKKRLKETLELLRQEEEECLKMEKEVQKLTRSLPQGSLDNQKRTGVVVRLDARRLKRA